MGACKTTFVTGTCHGKHLGKYSDCLDEALDSGSADASAGSTEFEGHVQLHYFAEDYPMSVDEGVPGSPVVRVPAGTYLVWTAGSGAVRSERAESYADALQVMALVESRYALWDNGCDPDEPDEHAECEDGCVATTSCVHCGKLIERLAKGGQVVWFDSGDDFSCPDGETQHEPR